LGLTRLRAFLKKHGRIALDTSIFIYQLEANPAYLEFTAEIFRWLETPSHSAVTSSITMAELLAHPYRAGNIPPVNQYFALLSLAAETGVGSAGPDDCGHSGSIAGCAQSANAGCHLGGDSHYERCERDSH
jgi:hypothetical protein